MQANAIDETYPFPREMQLFLLGYILIEICEIFSIGGFPLSDMTRIVRINTTEVEQPRVLMV